MLKYFSAFFMKTNFLLFLKKDTQNKFLNVFLFCLPLVAALSAFSIYHSLIFYLKAKIIFLFYILFFLLADKNKIPPPKKTPAIIGIHILDGSLSKITSCRLLLLYLISISLSISGGFDDDEF